MVELNVKETQLRGVCPNQLFAETEWVDPGVYTVGREAMFDGQLHTLISSDQRSFWVLTMHLHTAITGNPKPTHHLFDTDILEAQIQQHGLQRILHGITQLCFDKADRMQTDEGCIAKSWEKSGYAILTMLNSRTWPS